MIPEKALKKQFKGEIECVHMSDCECVCPCIISLHNGTSKVQLCQMILDVGCITHCAVLMLV